MHSHTNLCTCAHAHEYTCLHAYTRMHTCTHSHTYTHILMHTLTHPLTHTLTHTPMYTHMHTHAHPSLSHHLEPTRPTQVSEKKQTTVTHPEFPGTDVPRASQKPPNRVKAGKGLPGSPETKERSTSHCPAVALLALAETRIARTRKAPVQTPTASRGTRTQAEEGRRAWGE